MAGANTHLTGAANVFFTSQATFKSDLKKHLAGVFRTGFEFDPWSPEAIRVNASRQIPEMLDDIDGIEHTEVIDEYLKGLEADKDFKKEKPIYFRILEHDARYTFEGSGLVKNTQELE